MAEDEPTGPAAPAAPAETQPAVQERVPSPSVTLRDTLKTKLPPGDVVPNEAGDVLSGLLNNYEIQRSLTALTERVIQPVVPHDQRIRPLVESENNAFTAIRQQIFDLIDRPNLDQAQKDRLVNALFDTLKEAGILDLTLMNGLVIRRLDVRQQEVISGYRSVTPETAESRVAQERITNGLGFIEGRITRPTGMTETPQEELLAIYLNSIRLGTLKIDAGLISRLSSGQVTARDFASETFVNYQSFLPSVGLDIDKFCPNEGFYEKLCRGLGVRALLRAVGAAQRDVQERYTQAVQDASTSQGPLAGIRPETRHMTAFGVHYGAAFDLASDAMDTVGGWVPDPEHMFNADAGDLMQLGLKLYLGTVGLLNLAAMGTGTFNHLRNGLIALKNGEVSNAMNEITGIFKDAYQAIPGPVGTGVLALAWGASRFTSPEEAMDWMSGIFSAGATELQLQTGIDIQGMGRGVANWFKNTIGPYWSKGKQGVTEFFDNRWTEISSFTVEQKQAFNRWLDEHQMKLEVLEPYFAAKRDLATSLNAHLQPAEVGNGMSVSISGDQFNALMPIYLAKLKAPGVDIDTNRPSISYDELRQLGILTQAQFDLLMDKQKPPLPQLPPFTPSSDLARSIRAQGPTYTNHFTPPITR